MKSEVIKKFAIDNGLPLIELKLSYVPKFFSWCNSFEQEEKEMRETIDGNPADVKILKQEYYELTGKRYKRKG
jgi:hypothetical protein